MSNRNQQLIAKSQGYAEKLEELMKSVASLLENPQIIRAFLKGDVSGHLHEVRAISGPEALKKYLLMKAKEDPWKFGESLQILSYEYKHGLTKVTNQKLGDGNGQLGSKRVNPNVKASEPGRNISTEGFGEAAAGESLVAKRQRISAREIAIKSECARHCKKVGRANCLYCNGIGFAARSRMTNYPGNTRFPKE